MKKSNTVRMTPEMSRRLRAAAVKADVTISALVEAAVLEKLPDWETAAASRSRTEFARYASGK